jgi:hypothetical protein
MLAGSESENSGLQAIYLWSCGDGSVGEKAGEQVGVVGVMREQTGPVSRFVGGEEEKRKWRVCRSVGR